MVLGVGIDMASIADFETCTSDPASSRAFEERTFTARELAEADQRGCGRAEYLAGRFAVKEAAFKAVGRLAPADIVDLRIVETMSASDGRPVVSLDEQIAPALAAAGVTELLASITNEGPFAMAVVVAQ